ncbi:putative transcription factor MADS-MIKC family [Lupinus albus]|uniref:Putative transcription factor MADS-MIKC family n=1 Tax=Lupinus albus TaxID=3870 RepID=A0A6A4QNI7_LUPAL|nr:putative transcription factor MADS-MIKC family [Lupinus albus]
MGRGKVELKRIENRSNRQVTFSKRRTGLLKKAKELSVLCDAEVAVIIFSNTGKLSQFSSSDMNRTLSRYNKCVDSTETAVVEHKTEEEDSKMVEILRDEIEKLERKKLLLGKDLKGLSLKELQNLGKQLNEGLLSVTKRKEELVTEQLEQSRVQEQRVMLENETLRGQVMELRSLFPVTENGVPSYLQYQNIERNNTFVLAGAASSNLASNSGNDGGDSDTTLQLGFLNDFHHKRGMVSEKETSLNDSESALV